MRGDIIDKLVLQSDLILILDYSYAEINCIDSDEIIKRFTGMVLDELQPFIKTKKKMKQIKEHLGL